MYRLALSASSTHDLIAQSVRALELYICQKSVRTLYIKCKTCLRQYFEHIIYIHICD